MIRHYLTVALRNLRRDRVYAGINIAGLAVGMACFLLIALYVQDELGYDRYHEKGDRVFRITREHGGGTNATLHFAFVGPPFAPALADDYVEVEQAVRFTHESGTMQYGEKLSHEERFYFADAGVFEVFTFPMITGNPSTALKEQSTVVLTESTARKYFGAEDPMGKVLTYKGQHPLTVTGIIRDVPANSHFRFDFLASYTTREAMWGDRVHTDDAWQWHNAATYLLLRDDSLADQLRAKLPSFLANHTSDNRIKFQTLHLQRLTDIHLYSHLDAELATNGDIRTVRLFITIAFLIILIACINFTNLATAQSAHRMIEVGIRKTLGSQRSEIVRQFLGESLLQAYLALAVAILMVELALPAYNVLTEKKLALSFLDNGISVVGLIGLPLFVGLLAGAYPAFFFMRVRPINLLSKRLHAGASMAGLRKVLVITQFAISMILIIGTVTVHRQLSYTDAQTLNVDKSLIVVLPVDDDVREKYDTVKQALLQHNDVINVAGSWDTPGHRFNTVMGPVKAQVNGEFTILQPGPKFFIVDHDFLPTYDLTLVAGRNFSPDFGTDDTEAFIVNESTVRLAGWPSPQEAVGKAFQYANRTGTIIGVVEDFHLESLHHTITPVVMYINPPWLQSLSVKIRAGDMPGVIRFIEQTWERLMPNQPFQYTFLDDQFHRQYLAEYRLEQVLSVFALLSMGIACLGLFGLSLCIAEQRTKEIGIRKVLGASISHILVLLSKDFATLIVIATVIACPIAYVAMARWLQDFAYRITPGVGTFVLAGALALLIALATIGVHAIRAALANPVEALRYE